MGSRRKHPLLTLLLLALLPALLTGACSKPAGNSRFIAAQQARSEGGVYRFDVHFDDTTALYTLELASRLVASQLPGETLSLNIRIVDPAGNYSIERVDLPLAEGPGIRLTHGGGTVVDGSWPWRDFPASGGVWHFLIQPADPAQTPALLGLGFSYTLKDPQYDGKR